MVPKKKKKNTNNPLSQARGNKLSAEDLWDRKTGVGFRSFVEYYTQQPVGTVSSATASSSTTAQEAESSSRGKRQVYSVEQNNQGRGLSRAAKRRKKKKGRLVSGGEQPSPSSESTTEQERDAVLTSRPLKANDDVNHPLLQAVEQMTSPHSRHDGSRREDLTPFFEAMARPLPLTFRIRSTADSKLVGKLQKKLQSLKNTTAASSSNNGIRPVFTRLDFDDDNMQVYQASCSKAALTADPEVKALLLENSQNGVMARQELGSMLPVAALASAGFLSSDATRRCLDMCASPGSKTLQALEVLHQLGKTTKAKQKLKSSAPKALLVANDILKSRLEALQQAVARSGVPESLTQSVVYTCQDATKFELRAVTAAARTKKKREPTTDATAAAAGCRRRPPLLHFDAILCDVPCSGDGTCRKDRHVLPPWKPAIGNQLHATQVAILSRAVALLEPGGCVCYSTCSLNPVENEAVVAAVLHEYNKNNDDDDHQPSLELERWPVIPGLILRDGISHWKIAHYRSSSGNTADPLDSTTTSDFDDDRTESDRRSDSSSKLMWYDTFEEAQRSSGGGKDQVWSPSMWPPPDAAQMNLSRCKRLFPQDNDSGGFFLALIRKKQTTK